MSLLSTLHPRLKLAAFQPASSEEQIRELIDFSPIPVPPEYLDLTREGSDLEIGVDLGSRGYWYIRIYGAEGNMSMSNAYKLHERLPGSLALGDNEGCDLLVLVPHAKQPGIYRIPMSCIDEDMQEAVYICADLAELLVEGKNLNLVF